MYKAEKIKHKSQNKWKINKKKITNIRDQILEISDVGVGEYYGFEVDKNHRFLLDSYIVTHNSFLVRDIFYNHKKIPKGLIFSGTESANPFFGDFFPDTFIHSETIEKRSSQRVTLSYHFRNCPEFGKSFHFFQCIFLIFLFYINIIVKFYYVFYHYFFSYS